MKIRKIGISLLIALCFILPSSAIIADPGNRDAANLISPDYGEYETKDGMIEVVGTRDQANNPVVLQATNTEIIGFYLEECNGDTLYEVTNGVIIPLEDCYEPIFQLNTIVAPSHFEPEIEIYLMQEHEAICIYETSFEDNAANYLEWGQIDLDSGIDGGYYDGWVWSDARSCGSDHSFKNTMYDEYKNMQDDILYLKKCIDLTANVFETCDGGSIEIDDIGTVTVSFDIFVDGEDDEYEWCDWRVPLDYLKFGLTGEPDLFMPGDLTWLFMNSACEFIYGNYIFYSTQNGLFDTQFAYDYTSFAEKIDGCPGWWHVWYTVDVDDLYNPECFSPYFEWISDKERVYEGAYVDNVEISVSSDLGEKIYQGHSQDWIDATVEGISWFEFPLDWDDDIISTVDFVDGVDENPAYYTAIIKIKNDTGGYAHWEEIDFEIGPYVDCAITDFVVEDDFSHEVIPDGGIVQYPSDAHVQFCYTNLGNTVQNNIAITATGYKMTKEELLFDDFEGPNSWVYFYDDYPVYISTDKAWSGTKSLAFNDPDTMHIRRGGRYIGYSQATFSMEGVEEAVIDWYYQAVLPDGTAAYLMLLGYYYVVSFTSSFITAAETPICQKEWIGPMQPMCQYASLNFKNYFDTMVNYDYMNDENGHQTWDSGIGFRLDTVSVADGDLYPTGCFAAGEQTWSGLYIDDISIKATVVDKVVWTETMIIPGPCAPGETCCAQFTWEDVPYSNYKICVAVDCAGDGNAENDEMCQEILVLEDLEHASKVEGVGYNECEPEAWCISNVVGNDCGNDGAGDMYALATNCDSPFIPEGVQDWVALEGIDVSHLEFGAGGGSQTGVLFEQPMGDPNVVQELPFSSDYYPYRAFDNFVLEQENEIDQVTFVGVEAYGNMDLNQMEFWLGFFPEGANADPSAAIQDDYWGPVGSNEEAVGSIWGYTLWKVTAPVTPIELEAGWFSAFSHDPVGWADFAWMPASTGMDSYSEQYQYTSPVAYNTYDLTFTLENLALLGAKEDVCEVILNEGFETCIPDQPATPPGWTNSGWLTDYYGTPCCEDHFAYSWGAGDTLTTPLLTFGNSTTTLTFQYKAESSSHPMDLEVYCDATMVWSSYGYTNTACLTATVDLTAFADEGTHTISFVGQTSDFYGQIIDCIIVETCNWFEPVDLWDPIWINGTYQVDIDDEYGAVLLQVAGWASVEGDGCEGCEGDDVCPSCMSGWTTAAVLSGNAPGVCQEFSVDVGALLTMNDTILCIRFLLDTTDAVYAPWYLPGIGFHLHELCISNIIYDPILGASDYCEDFEDGNLVNEETGLIWNIGCVNCAPEVLQCNDFQFCIADECAVTAPYECNEFNLHGVDSYGDGWDGVYNYVVDAFIDVYVNGVLVVTDFTVYDSTADAFFEACPGDEIEVIYDCANGGVYNSEHSFTLKDDYGTTWVSGGGNVDSDDTFTVPTEIVTMDGEYPAEPFDAAIVWSTEIMDAYEAYLTAGWEYEIGAGATLTFEISADGGDTWFTIAKVVGPATYGPNCQPIPCTPFDLTPWAGKALLIRVHLVNNGVDTDANGIADRWYAGHVCVCDIMIAGKQDFIPPTATISLSGNLIAPGLYAGPVTVTITAEDDMAMGSIHYILDGSETVVAGDKATFKVSTDGDHCIEYWAVDLMGNEGAHNTVCFSIDLTAPTVSITAPEPGLYLFGRKLLSMSKPFIIGAFTAEATASDNQGIAVVKFMLDGEVVGEDTSVPYSTYVAVKHMGAGTLKVTAEDGVGNTAEDTLDITYYKFL